MLGKKTKREIEDEIYEQHPDLEVIKRGEGMSSKELYKIAYDRMKVLDKELADDRKGWKRLLLR